MNTRHYLLLLAFLLCGLQPLAAQDDADELKQLQSEMYKYFSTPEQEKFMDITKRLKELSLKVGDEQMFYRAWGNEAIYEATHQHRTHAKEIAKDMKEYAKQHDSRFGEYTALHVAGAVYLQMQNYADAETNFLESIEALHKYFPGKSAAPAYLELMKIANKSNDWKRGTEYARKTLEEPNLEPQHKIRALSMLCQYSFALDLRDDYNKYYAMWTEVKQQISSAGSLEPTVELDYRIINGKYEEALQMTDKVPISTRYEREATIYHRMGDDSKAYQAMVKHRHTVDSINRESQSNLLSDYIIQSQNEHLENEQLRLEEENAALRTRFFITIAAFVVALLALIIYQRQRQVSNLKHDNKQLDEARSEAEKARGEAEKALDVKREFLNNISHELRTPLNPITGMSDILATTEYELQPEEREMMSSHIKSSAKLLTHIVDNMVELSFYESKHTLPQEDVISPNIICQSMIDAVQHMCPAGVELVFESTIPNDLKLHTNLEGVNKILKNLLENAFAHTEKGSITISCADAGKHITLAVTDTGTGIPLEQREHLFEMFVETKEDVKTTGMGLSICQAILKLLDGRIWLDTDYTQGARFVFELPKTN